MAGPYKLDNQYTNFSGTNFAPTGHWLANTVAVVGDRIIAESGNVGNARFYVFECTAIAGDEQTGGAAPTWDLTPGNTTVDDQVTWTTREATVWTNAHGRMDWILLHVAAGETLHVDDGDNEAHSPGATIELLSNGTVGNPVKIICVDKADDSTSTGAIFKQDSVNTLEFQGTAYAYGIIFESDSFVGLILSSVSWTFENCTLKLNTAATYLQVGGVSAYAEMILLNSVINLVNADNYIRPLYNSVFVWRGGTLTAGNGSTELFGGFAEFGPIRCIIEDVDLSASGANALVDVGDGSTVWIDFIRCKLDAGVSIVTGAWPAPGRVRAHHCSNTANTYEFYESCYEGTIEEETTVVRTGGASDGTTSLAWKMSSSANVKEYIQPLISPPMTTWNAITGSGVTATVYFTKPDTEGVDYDDDEVWIEVEYPANDGGKGLIVFDRAGCGGSFNTRDPQAVPAAQADDTSNWGGVDHDDNPQGCHVTFTPALAGPVTARVFFAKASKVIFVDPKVYLT